MSQPDLQQQINDLTKKLAGLEKLLGGQALLMRRQGLHLAELAERGTAPSDPVDDVSLPDDSADEADAAASSPAPAQDDTKAPAPDPAAWVDYATAREWEELAAWVAWLQATYDFRPNSGVPPCWPAHSGAVEELAALRASWREAANEARPAVTAADGTSQPGPQADSSALIHWHDRWLAPLLTRLRTLYQASNCSQGHSAPMAGRTTDGKLLTEALAKVRSRQQTSSGH